MKRGSALTFWRSAFTLCAVHFLPFSLMARKTKAVNRSSGMKLLRKAEQLRRKRLVAAEMLARKQIKERSPEFRKKQRLKKVVKDIAKLTEHYTAAGFEDLASMAPLKVLFWWYGAQLFNFHVSELSEWTLSDGRAWGYGER